MATKCMKESWANQKELCIYDEQLQNARVVHFLYDDYFLVCAC